MEAQVDNYELRPFANLWTPPTTKTFPMWYQLLKLDDEFVTIDLSDYDEPEPGTIFQIGSRLFDFIDVIDTHLCKGVFDGIEIPTWFRLRCLEVTGAKLKYAGPGNSGKVFINLTDKDED